MANKDIKESQQSSQGIAIGTQGNQAGSVPGGRKGSHQDRDPKEEHRIPNQERSSASSSNKEGREQGRH